MLAETKKFIDLENHCSALHRKTKTNKINNNNKGKKKKKTRKL